MSIWTLCYCLCTIEFFHQIKYAAPMMKKQDQKVGEDEQMAVSGNMATVTT